MFLYTASTSSPSLLKYFLIKIGFLVHLEMLCVCIGGNFGKYNQKRI